MPVNIPLHNPPAWLGGYEPYGVDANALSAVDVFALYDRCGFLYPAKRAMLDPFMASLTDTWQRTLSTESRRQALHHCLTCGRDGAAGASLSYWRSTPRRFHSQHLVSWGIGDQSRRVMLAGQDAVATATDGEFTENWFREENRLPARVFGSVPDRLGADRAAVERRHLLAVPKDPPTAESSRVRVSVACNADGHAAAVALARFAGPVIAQAEELDHGDIEIRSLDDQYRTLGLRRFRKVFVATLGPDGQPAGIASAYRGPLGLNFSFLENRCDLWLDPDLDPQARANTATALIEAVLPMYSDSVLPRILIACDTPTRDVLTRRLAADPIRTYLRCVWLRSGFWDWHRHVDSFYARSRELQERRQARRPAPADSEREGANA